MVQVLTTKQKNNQKNIKPLFDEFTKSFRISEEILKKKTQIGTTFVTLAIDQNNDEILKKLSAANFDWNSIDPIYAKDGLTYVHSAAFLNLAALKKLHTLKVNLNVVSKGNETLVHMAGRNRSLELLKFLSSVDTFDKKNFDLPNSNGLTPIEFAISKDAVDVVEFLIKEHGVQFNKSKKVNRDLMSICVKNGFLDMLDLLKKYDFLDLNQIDSTGSTLAHMAVKEKRQDILKFLIKHHVDINILDQKSKTPLHYIVENKDIGLLACLTGLTNIDWDKKDADENTPLHLAADKFFIDGIKLLIDQGADVDSTNQHGETFAHILVKHETLMKDWSMLIDLIPKINWNNTDEENATPLHYAAENNIDAEVLYKILPYIKDLNCQNIDGNTLLHIFSEAGNLDAIKILIAADADFTLENEDGKTPLALAQENKMTEVAEYIMSLQGASDDIANLDRLELNDDLESSDDEPNILMKPKMAHTFISNLTTDDTKKDNTEAKTSAHKKIH